jgi:hypothetical protein
MPWDRNLFNYGLCIAKFGNKWNLNCKIKKPKAMVFEGGRKMKNGW